MWYAGTAQEADNGELTLRRAATPSERIDYGFSYDLHAPTPHASIPRSLHARGCPGRNPGASTALLRGARRHPSLVEWICAGRRLPSGCGRGVIAPTVDPSQEPCLAAELRHDLPEIPGGLAPFQPHCNPISSPL